MIRKINVYKSLAFIITAGLVVFGTGCTEDESYKLEDLDQIDTEVSLFEDGIAVPIGSTNKISIGDLLSGEGESLDDFLKTNANGEYSIFYDGQTSFGQAIEDLNLSDYSSISAVSLNKKFTFDVGANTNSFSIPASTYEKCAGIEGFDMLDFSIVSASSYVKDLHIYAGLDKYNGIIEKNDNLDLGNKVEHLGHNTTLLKRSVLSSAIAASPTDEIKVPSQLLPPVTVNNQQFRFSIPSISIHEDVTAVKDIKLDPDAKVIIEIKLNNVFLSDGEAVPDIDIDFSKILNIKNGSKINLNDLVLNSGNGWKSSKTLPILGLAKTEFGNPIVIDENVTLNGSITVSNPVATKTLFNETSGDLVFEVSVRFQNFKIVSATTEFDTIEIEKSSQITLAKTDKDIELPKELKDVKRIDLDESAPFVITIRPNNLDLLKTKEIPYSIDLDFPASMSVEGAVDGKLSFSGNLSDGAMRREVVIKSIEPNVVDGKISFDGTVHATSKAIARKVSLSSEDIPSDSDEDVSFVFEVDGAPKIKDFLITVNEINEPVQMKEDLEVDVSDIGDFGSFIVIPEKESGITMKIDLPELSGAEIVPGHDGMKISLPDIIGVDTQKIAKELSFDANDNSITIKDKFPEQIFVPIKQLEITPIKDDGKSLIRSSIGVEGNVCIPETDLNQNDLEGVFEEGFSIIIEIPEIKAESITLKDDFCFNVKEQYDLVILSKDDFPSELVSVDEAVLDNTFINIDAVFDGLGDGSFDIDLTLTLPDFITPSAYPIKGKIVAGKYTGAPLEVNKISDIDFTEGKDITGTITVEGTIKSSGATIDLSSLGEDLNVSLNATIGNEKGKIDISKITGKFNYNISSSETLEIGDVPESFKEEDVILDLANPQICLDLISNLGIPVAGSIDIVPIVGGKEISDNMVSIANLSLPYSSDPSKKETRKYCVCNTKADCAAGYEPLEANLSTLFRQIPDGLKLTVNAKIDDTQVSIIETKADYTFDIDYRLDVPLSFGEDFHFSTETTLDMSDAEVLTDMGNFSLKGKTINDSPIGLSINLSLIDGDGAVIPQSKPCSVNIAPASTSDIVFDVSPSDKNKKIKEAKLTISVTAKPGVTLKKTDSVQLVDIVAIAPEGLTISTK